ncbi:11228_t:CDS:2 [Entrophospora sp. SA101]|nr:11228_t:CDS:2 [Entrophospora sp. SA101]
MGVEDESSKQEQQLKTQNGSSITQLGALEDDEFEEFNAEEHVSTELNFKGYMSRARQDKFMAR